MPSSWYINRAPNIAQLDAGVQTILRLLELAPKLNVVLLQGSMRSVLGVPALILCAVAIDKVKERRSPPHVEHPRCVLWLLTPARIAIVVDFRCRAAVTE